MLLDNMYGTVFNWISISTQALRSIEVGLALKFSENGHDAKMSRQIHEKLKMSVKYYFS